MNFKTLMQTLLNRFYSKSESAAVSRLGYPTANYISMGTWSKPNSWFINAQNGWFLARCRADGVNQFLNVALNGSFVQEVRSTDSGALLTVFVPVASGDRVDVDCSVTNPNFDAYGVYKNIGSS